MKTRAEECSTKTSACSRNVVFSAENIYEDPDGRFSFRYPKDIDYYDYTSGQKDTSYTKFFDKEIGKFKCMYDLPTNDPEGCTEEVFRLGKFFSSSTASEYENYKKELNIRDTGDRKEYIDSQGRTWQTELQPSESYNYVASTKVGDVYYVVFFQQGRAMETSSDLTAHDEVRTFFDDIIFTFDIH
jgi:hypothetical protein